MTACVRMLRVKLNIRCYFKSKRHAQYVIHRAFSQAIVGCALLHQINGSKMWNALSPDIKLTIGIWFQENVESFTLRELQVLKLRAVF